jgi:hypothetical protein
MGTLNKYQNKSNLQVKFTKYHKFIKGLKKWNLFWLPISIKMQHNFTTFRIRTDSLHDTSLVHTKPETAHTYHEGVQRCIPESLL